MGNEAGPNLIGYFKHLTSELLMDNEMFQLPFPEFKKERLKAILNESVGFLTRETDRMSDQIIAKLHMELDSSNEEKLSNHSHKSDERINDCSRKRKASSIATKDCGSANNLIQNPVRIGKVYSDAQALQGNAEIGKDLQKCPVELQAELDKMGQDLEEFIDIIFSKCRPMSSAEKEQLGRQMKKLPEKAFNRVVEIVLRNNPSEAEPSEVFVNLETQDNVTLWRLYYYVQTVLGVNKLSNRSPIPFPLV